ncbi:MAG: VTT domain-containing protein [Chloroflexi bacterium]|nr:VTT domain-containing protein [Chloroflexota bacterium]
MVTSVITTITPGFAVDRKMVALLVAIGLAILLPVLLHNYIPDAQSFAGAGYAALFVVGFLSGATFFLPMPILPLVFTAGGIFNPGLVALSSATGMAAGMGLTYFIGAWIRHLINWRIATRADRLGAAVRNVGAWLNHSSFVSAFALAAVPNPIYDFAGVIAGSAHAPIGRFMLGIFLGKMVQAIVVAVAGSLAWRIPGLG